MGLKLTLALLAVLTGRTAALSMPTGVTPGAATGFELAMKGLNATSGSGDDPAWFVAFSSCMTGLGSSCASSDASCSSDMLALISSGKFTAADLAAMQAATKACLATYSDTVNKLNPTRRRLNTECPSSCQKNVDCVYDDLSGCLDKISSLPSGLKPATTTYVGCLAKAEGCSDPGSFVRSTGFIVLLVAIGAVVCIGGERATHYACRIGLSGL